VTRNTTKFVSSILEQYNSRYTFYKLFKSIFEIIFFKTEIPPYRNLLGAPGAVHPEVLPRGTCGQARPTRQPKPKQGPTLIGRLSPPVSSLAVRSPPGAPRNEADPMRQEWALKELGRELDSAHGGAVARLVGGTPTSATAGHGEARKNFTTARRCSCARKEGERWSREGLSAWSQAPVRKNLLQRGITGQRRLTTANRLEHRLQKVEAMLLARWRWLRRTGAAGTANSGDGAWWR